MSFCDKCGEQLKEGAKFCPRCGSPVGTAGNTQANQNQQYQGQQYQNQNQQNYYQSNQYQNTNYDVSQNKVMAVLSYFGILCLIPLLAAKDSPYARFHANQGLVLFLSEIVVAIALSILSSIFTVILWPIAIIISILTIFISIGFLVLMIIGIVNAVQGQEKELPIIGKIRLVK